MEHLQLLRGNLANLPALLDGEVAIIKDTKKMAIGVGGVNYQLVSQSEHDSLAETVANNAPTVEQLAVMNGDVFTSSNYDTKTESATRITNALANFENGEIFSVFDTFAALELATGMKKSQYAFVRADENYENATTRYDYDGAAWDFTIIIDGDISGIIGDVAQNAEDIVALQEDKQVALSAEQLAVVNANAFTNAYKTKIDELSGMVWDLGTF